MLPKTLKSKAIPIDKPKTKKQGKIANAKVANSNNPNAKIPKTKIPKTKVLFIMFQGSITNQKHWNEHTKSKFLDRLKELGSVYTYQDKTYNIFHYDIFDLEHKDFDSDIDFDLSYVSPDTHIKIVYDDIKKKYKNIKDYKFIPIAWSGGSMLALYFAQVYSSQCIHVILLDPNALTPNTITKNLNGLKKVTNGIYPITNAKYKKMLQALKKTKTDLKDILNIYFINGYIRVLFTSQHLKLELPVPTLAFVNLQKPEGDEWSIDFNNKLRLEQVKTLEKHNPENYKAIIFTNETHYIFNSIQSAKAIIKEIKKRIDLP